MIGAPLLATLALALAPGGPADGAPPFWGGLEPGPYAVGFRSWWVTDPGRRYTWRPEDRALLGGGEPPTGPRPVLVNAWYPAPPEHDGPALLHGGYLDIAPAGDELGALGALPAALAAYARDVVALEVTDQDAHDLTPEAAAALEAAFATPTAARRDAPAADGPFPVVLYHSGYGSSFEDNAVLCELLASHGYVVLGSAFLRRGGESFNVDGRDDSLADLEHLLRQAADAPARGLPAVDLTRVGMAGHSGGAHVSLEFAARPRSPVDAVVALDTTQDHHSVHDRRWWRLIDATVGDTEHLVEPVLLATGPTAAFQLADTWSGAERFYLTFPTLDHNDYIHQGILRAETLAGLPGGEVTAAQAAALRTEYEALCRRVVRFLDAHLEDDADAAHALRTGDRDGALGAGVHLELAPRGVTGAAPYDRASAAPPTPRELRRLLRDEGPEAALAVLREHHEAHPDAPVYQLLNALAYVFELVAEGDTAAAQQAADFYRPLHPDLGFFYRWFAGNTRSPESGAYREHALAAALLWDPEDAEALRLRDELRAEAAAAGR